MAYTQIQYETLKAAIAQGALSVKFGDKEVVYRSLKEQKEILAMMASELGATSQTVNRKYIQYSKGLS